MAGAPALTIPSPIQAFIERNRNLLMPVAALGLIFVVLTPLPTAMIDFLLVANITVSALVMMTVMYIASPLELSVFPSLLLGLALFRLVLNTATTRLILSNAEAETAAAGDAVATGVDDGVVLGERGVPQVEASGPREDVGVHRVWGRGFRGSSGAANESL